VVDDRVLTAANLELPGVPEVTADRLRALFRRAAEDIVVLKRRAALSHDLHRHVAVVVVRDVPDRVVAEGLDLGAVAAGVLPGP
jgi:hypothetical protein